MHCSEVDETATGSANFFGPAAWGAAPVGLQLTSPEIPFRSSAAASAITSTPATVRAWRSSQVRAAPRMRLARSGVKTRRSSATLRGSSETSAKKTHSTKYWAALGFVSEIVFSASGMKAPGFASAAPAPTSAA